MSFHSRRENRGSPLSRRPRRKAQGSTDLHRAAGFPNAPEISSRGERAQWKGGSLNQWHHIGHAAGNGDTPYDRRERRARNRNATGRNQEDDIARILYRAGIEYEREKRKVYKKANGSWARVDFWIPPHEFCRTSLVIESRRQESHGTACSKFEELVMNLKKYCPYPSIIVEDGGGAPDKYRKWLREQVDEKLIAVFTVSELETYIRKNDFGDLITGQTSLDFA